MARGGARSGAGRPKKTADPKAPRLPGPGSGGARPGAGRPMSKKFAPTVEQRGNVEAMTGFGISREEICLLIKNPETGKPIDRKTLRLHFPEEIATGHTRANAASGRRLPAPTAGLKTTAAARWRPSPCRSICGSTWSQVRNMLFRFPALHAGFDQRQEFDIVVRRVATRRVPVDVPRAPEGQLWT
jgi:hypothetical protein